MRHDRRRGESPKCQTPSKRAPSLSRRAHFCRNPCDSTFFWLAGEIGATVFGFDEQKMLRRAVEQILANLESAEFNSLEIMRLASEASKRFLGVRYVTVSAQSRHIQESAFLFGAKDPPVMDRARSAAA